MSKFIAAAVAALMFATPALADPNIDMSRITLNGATLEMNFTSQAVAGAQISGTKRGTITASTEAWNVAGGFGGVGFEMEGDTDNAGPGVSGEMGVHGGGQFVTFTEGGASASTSGKGDRDVFAGTFGSAAMDYEGTFKHTMRTDDWN